MDNAEEPAYCTPEDVAATIDLPGDNQYGTYEFSDVSHPTYKQVCDMIRSNQNIIDNRLRKSWRENYVKDY